jgi:BirA family biotin operon repressor/biotin-[acetyl-CoA-carboxylase] ligase
MDDVRRQATESPEGLTIVARHQTGGRGRGGRAWRSTPGSSLLFSTLLRPMTAPDRFAAFPVLAALAVVDAITAVGGVKPAVKWPNDVLIEGRKVAGILVTSTVEAGIVQTAIVGIGVNCAAVSGEVDASAVSLEAASGRAVDRDRLLETILTGLEGVYSRVLVGDIEALVGRWNGVAAYRDERVCVEEAGGTTCGELLGISRAGALALRSERGSLVEIRAGDLTRGPQPAGRAALG